jgi:lysophospholipase L1-like esterase
VIVSFVKAIDWIKQLNPNAKIIFLTYGSNIIVNDRAERMCRYLEQDYFKMFDFNFPVHVYCELYYDMIASISKVVSTMTLFSDELIDDKYVSSDGLHFNEQGHELIANKLLSQVTF